MLVTKHIVGIDGEQLRSCFKSLHDTNNPSVLAPGKTLKIPKIMHFVWLGSPLPDAFKDYILSWARVHEGHGWKFKLWTDEDVKNFKLINQEFYDATDSYGVKSDLLKWEIIYRYGGVYLDVDFECYQLLDDLHYTYDFYTAIQPLDTQYLQLGAAVFAACPGHPILKHCIETIKNDWNKKGAPAKSGPIHFTRSFFVTAGKTPSLTDIAFPALYFYPLGCTEKTLYKDEWIAQGAWGVHHWAKSWMPASYRPQEFKKLFNDHLVKTWND
jgi:mannosyltransferase OCH1-like enzyme